MSLKDELLKAKLISKKDLKRLEHEERIERQKLGKEGVNKKKKQKQTEIELKQREKKQRDKEIAKSANQKKRQKESHAQLGNIISRGKIADGSRGPRKFYFVAADNSIPFLQVTDDLARKLEHGRAAIVEIAGKPFSQFSVVNENCAKRLLDSNPETVRFYNRISD